MGEISEVKNMGRIMGKMLNQKVIFNNNGTIKNINNYILSKKQIINYNFHKWNKYQSSKGLS